MSKKQLSIEEIEKSVSYNKAIAKNLFIFYAIFGPIFVAVIALMVFAEGGKYAFSYGLPLGILFILCTVYVIMAYVRRKRVINELIRQQNAKKK